MVDYNKINGLCNRLASAVIANYDELITELECPAICLSLLGGGFEIPNRIKESLGLPDDAFVDELFGDFEDVKNGYGLSLCFSVNRDDCIERIDDIDVDEMDIPYLERLVEYAENHKGLHIN